MWARRIRFSVVVVEPSRHQDLGSGHYLRYIDATFVHPKLLFISASRASEVLPELGGARSTRRLMLRLSNY